MPQKRGGDTGTPPNKEKRRAKALKLSGQTKTKIQFSGSRGQPQMGKKKQRRKKP